MKIGENRSDLEKDIFDLISKSSNSESRFRKTDSGVGESDYWDAYLDHKGKLLFLSISFTNLTGHPKEDFISGARDLSEIIHNEDYTRFNELKDFPAENILFDTSVRLVDPNEKAKRFSVSCIPVFDNKHNLAGSRIRFTSDYESFDENENLFYDESLLRLILNHTDQGIIVVDEKWNIVGWNKCVENVMGIPREKVLNEKVWKIQYGLATSKIKEITTEEDFRKIWEHQIFPMKKGEFISGYGSVINTKGEVEYVKDMIRPIEINGKKYFISFQTYYTDYKKVEDELRSKIEELATANMELELFAYSNNELKQFAYTASHQLQEPARTISNFSRIIEEDYSGVLDSNALNYLYIIRHAAQRMSSLINIIYEYSVLGRKSRLSYTDCNKPVDEVIQGMADIIRDSGAEVIVEKLPVLNIYESEFQRLIKNLLDNAIKFRRDGIKPEIAISASRVDGKFIFSVKDNGIGIDPVHREKIFDLFQRLHANEDKYEGKGVGLAFCKKIVSLHHGEIWLQESKGRDGCEFCFSIPVK